MPELKLRIGCVVLAVVMSAVTYYFVEPRLRWGRYGGFKAAGLLSVMVVVGVAGYSIERHGGYTARMNDSEQEVIDAINKRMEEDNQRCLKEIPDWNEVSPDCVCRLQREPGKNTIALIGDSHAEHLYPGLIANTNENEGIALFPAGSAIPLIGLQSPAGVKKSDHVLTEGFRYILSHKNITKVVLSHQPGGSWYSVIDTLNPGNQNFDSILHDGFVRTYDALTRAGKEIYVVLDSPLYSHESWSKCNASVVHRPFNVQMLVPLENLDDCSVKLRYIRRREAWDNWNKVSRELAKGYDNIHFIDLENFFCPNLKCSMIDDAGKLIYRDTSHLNIHGSFLVAPFLINQLRN